MNLMSHKCMQLRIVGDNFSCTDAHFVHVYFEKVFLYFRY
jgi:hypothetical protein